MVAFAGGRGHVLVTAFRGMALNGLLCADVLRPLDLVLLTDFIYNKYHSGYGYKENRNFQATLRGLISRCGVLRSLYDSVTLLSVMLVAAGHDCVYNCGNVMLQAISTRTCSPSAIAD